MCLAKPSVPSSWSTSFSRLRRAEAAQEGLRFLEGGRATDEVQIKASLKSDIVTKRRGCDRQLAQAFLDEEVDDLSAFPILRDGCDLWTFLLGQRSALSFISMVCGKFPHLADPCTNGFDGAWVDLFFRGHVRVALRQNDLIKEAGFGLACANNGSGFTPANQTVEGAEIQISFFLQWSVTFDAMIIEDGLQIS